MAARQPARGVLDLVRAAYAQGALRKDIKASSCQAQRCIATSSSSREPDISEEWYLRQRNTIVLGNRIPNVADGVWVAPNAVVAGDVDLLDRVSIWYGAVLRGDLNNITVESCSNIQDRTVIHAARTSPSGLTAATLVGKYVTVEPNCILRSCRIVGHNIIGARSVLMEGSMVEQYAILAPGTVLPPARRVPEGELWAGNPAKFVRKITKDEKAAFEDIADEIRKLAVRHKEDQLPYGTAWRQVEEWRAAQIAAGVYDWSDARGARYKARIEGQKEEAAKQLQ